VRQEWEKARKVDIDGQYIELSEAPELRDATWLKESLARAKQSLPNGYCGLPPKNNCAHANACLTCPVFITTPEFLPVHRTHLIATEDLLVRARAQGQSRVIEMNERVANNLTSIIKTLENTSEDEEK
jgi:hypothetical protein